MTLEETLRTLSISELRQAMDYVRHLLFKHKDGPKWPGGETLWHKGWKKTVRAVYPDSDEDCDFGVIVFWDDKRAEWIYRDKYTGNDMYESDLETYNHDIHKDLK